MSVSEIKASLQSASADDKLLLLAWLKHDIRAGTATRMRHLADANTEIESGDRISLAAFKRLNLAMDEAGL